ncbi:MAG: hypothetical protein Q8O67_22915 [Deltaproteobacteria bacterium]|nr:hypothetical protein [Deltaproteobacteria bacterium]
MASANTSTVFEVDPHAVERELASLTFSRVITENPMVMVRAAHWHNLLDGLGLGLPFFLVHDLGLLLTQPLSQITLQRRDKSLKLAIDRGNLRVDANLDRLLQGYGELLVNLARSELCQKATSSGLQDELLAAVIAKVVEPVATAVVRKGHNRKLPLTVPTYEGLEPAHYVNTSVVDEVKGILATIVDARTRIRVSLEEVDLDTLKLLEMFKGEEGMGGEGAADLLDLYRALATPAAHDIANFSLDLLPSILETKKSSGVQTFSVDGYASVETRGNLDSILPSELAYDDDLFDRRYADNELFYYGREKQDTQRERLHYILVDASASMRGLRTVFARGLALALAKKMTLRGETVWLRFFDSRLYERQELSAAKMRIPYLLCFRSERGRNTTRVFQELERELQRLQRESPKEVVVTFITHGRCQVDAKVVEVLRNRATLSGVFVTTQTDEIQLDWLDKLHTHHVVAPDVLGDKNARKGEALKILGER